MMGLSSGPPHAIYLTRGCPRGWDWPNWPSSSILTFITDVGLPIEGVVASAALLAAPGVIAIPRVIAVPHIIAIPCIIAVPRGVGVVEGRGPAHTLLPQVSHEEL